MQSVYKTLFTLIYSIYIQVKNCIYFLIDILIIGGLTTKGRERFEKSESSGGHNSSSWT